MKHLKVRARLVPPLWDQVDIEVLEQTHSNYAFGGFGHGTDWINSNVFAYNDVRIRNKQTPGFEVSGFKFSIHLTLGEGNAVGVTIRVPTRYWPEIKEAIVAYNSLGREE